MMYISMILLLITILLKEREIRRTNFILKFTRIQYDVVCDLYKTEKNINEELKKGC